MAATRRRLRTSHQAIRPPAARRSHRSVQWWGRRGSTTYSSTRLRSRTRSVNAPRAGAARIRVTRPSSCSNRVSRLRFEPPSGPGVATNRIPGSSPKVFSSTVRFPLPPLSAFPSPLRGRGGGCTGRRPARTPGRGLADRNGATLDQPVVAAKRRPGGILGQGERGQRDGPEGRGPICGRSRALRGGRETAGWGRGPICGRSRALRGGRRNGPRWVGPVCGGSRALRGGRRNGAWGRGPVCGRSRALRGGHIKCDRPSLKRGSR